VAALIGTTVGQAFATSGGGVHVIVVETHRAAPFANGQIVARRYVRALGHLVRKSDLS
jgi:hypothetical protein